MKGFMHHRPLLLVGLLSALFPGDAEGQIWTGTVADAQSGIPIQGAFVTLELGDEPLVLRRLTRADGGFSIAPDRDAVGQGVPWTLRVWMLGYATIEQSGLTPASGVVRLDLALTPQPLLLEGLVAETQSDRQCSPLTPGDGTLLATLWEEARKSLEIAAWGQRGRHRFVLRTYSQEMDPRTLVARAEEPPRERTTARPFESLTAGELNRVGWARWDPPGSRGEFVVFDAPDPDALLSSDFQSRYCFGIRLHPDDPNQVGISFRPEDPRGPIGLLGVVWVDRNSGRLRSLSFTYTGYPGYTDILDGPDLPEYVRRQLGGEVRFRTLPDGEVVVDRWYIRMPLQTARSILIREEGGELVRAITPTGRVVHTEEGRSPIP